MQKQVALMVNYSNDDGNITDSDNINDKLGNSDELAIAVLLDLAISPCPKLLKPMTQLQSVQPVQILKCYQFGGIPPQVKIYYGTNDGGTNPSSWASVLDIGNKTTGEFFNLIGDLQPGTTYHYQVRAFNEGALGGEWAPTSKSSINHQQTIQPMGN